jgi:serine/threonine protein kinase
MKKQDNSKSQFQTNRVHGTAAWMAPEMMSGSKDVTSATDVFSFGVVLWECVTFKVLLIDDCTHTVLILYSYCTTFKEPTVYLN